MRTALTMAAPAQDAGYQVISNDPNGLEIRFHGVPLRAVHGRSAAAELDAECALRL